MLRQELGTNKFLLLGEISDADRLGRLEGAARRRAEVGRQRGGADGTILPAEPTINRRSDVSGRY